ncbi:MAG: c-type cytochrome [Achromobacter sp.]|uniref:c-type cytochrome n=1 Tax=Achromobacter sp. TaxID=134375 RepID=UPI0029B92D54|nr:c-type cytochrome [Achromobacter sp.]MDX3983648.1 c-type cytochrome [Achromobacter sp.]
MRRWPRIAAWCVAALAGAGAAAGSAVVYFGWYDVSATGPHTMPVYALLDVASTRSVKLRSADIKVPDLDSPQRIRRGDALYRAHCAQCHGGPGQAPESYALGLNPPPPPLVTSARERPAAEVFWIIRQGIKMTGMPAWQYRMTDEQIWDVVGYLRVLPTLSAQQYRDAAPPGDPASGGASSASIAPTEAQPSGVRAGDRRMGDTGVGEMGVGNMPAGDMGAGGMRAGGMRAGDMRLGDAKAGRDALQQYLCVTCHAIPGVPGARHYVGPSLDGMADRSRIAGVVPNSPDSMQQWLLDPQRIKPGTAMPALGLREQDARDIAAFLQTLSNVE